MNMICQQFSQCSNYVLNWISKQPEIKEESITDWLLFEISERLPNVKYKQFSRFEEGKATGADWEWWILFSDGMAFKARVQAKKLKKDKDNYAGIAYTSNDMLQIERLLSQCERENYAPLYSFYSEERGASKCFRNHNSDGAVYLADANEIHQEFILKPKAKLSPGDILKYTNPMECFFCCPINIDVTLESFKTHIERYFPFLKNADNSITGFAPAPTWIIQFPDPGSNSWWEKEYHRNLSEIQALLVVDLRGKNPQ